MSINRVTISGNLTRDPELRMTTNGTQVMNFGLAVNDRRRNQQTGEWEDNPNFVECVVFGQRAESLSRILRKGFKCAIEGKLRQNTWESDGQRRSRIEVVVDDLDFMQSNRPPQQFQQNPPQRQYQPRQQPQQQQQQYPQPAPEPSFQARLAGADDVPF